MLCNYKVIFKVGGWGQLSGLESFETHKHVPVVLDGNSVSILVFEEGTSIGLSSLQVP